MIQFEGLNPPTRWVETPNYKNVNLDTDFREFLSTSTQAIINNNYHLCYLSSTHVVIKSIYHTSSTHIIINSCYHPMLLSNVINSYHQLMLSKPQIIGHVILKKNMRPFPLCHHPGIHHHRECRARSQPQIAQHVFWQLENFHDEWGASQMKLSKVSYKKWNNPGGDWHPEWGVVSTYIS